MLEYYCVSKEVYHNGDMVCKSRPGFGFMEEEEVQEKTIYEVNWDNLEEIAQKLYGLDLMIVPFRKGRRVSFQYCSLFKKNFRDVKEWKEPLNLEVHILYRKITPSLKELINWHDCYTANKYMKEHGIGA